MYYRHRSPAIPFLFEAAGVLATFIHPNHRVYGDSLTCRRPATPSHLGIHASVIAINTRSFLYLIPYRS
ncbi:hypothetical protein FKN93_04605 [Vibrio sp. A8-1]|nr:hypothetical protein [Vibrio sp. A8-1]